MGGQTPPKPPDTNLLTLTTNPTRGLGFIVKKLFTW
jgi:hypothetical protein